MGFWSFVGLTLAVIVVFAVFAAVAENKRSRPCLQVTDRHTKPSSRRRR